MANPYLCVFCISVPVPCLMSPLSLSLSVPQVTRPALNIDKLTLLRDVVKQPYLAETRARGVLLRAALQLLRVCTSAAELAQSACW